MQARSICRSSSPKRIEFLVNLQAAQRLGLAIRPDVAAQVTEWLS